MSDSSTAQLHQQIERSIAAGDKERARDFLREALKKPTSETYRLAAKVALNEQQRLGFLRKAEELEEQARHEKPALVSMVAQEAADAVPVATQTCRTIPTATEERVRGFQKGWLLLLVPVVILAGLYLWNEYSDEIVATSTSTPAATARPSTPGKVPTAKSASAIWTRTPRVSATRRAPTKTPVPAPSNTPLPAVGTVTGAINYGSDALPYMGLYFQNVQTNQITALWAPSDWTYRIELPVGEYIAYAWLPDMKRGAVYSEYALCGQHASCPEDHAPLPFSVKGGAVTEGVDFDWLGDTSQIPRPSPADLVLRDPAELEPGASWHIPRLDATVTGLRFYDESGDGWVPWEERVYGDYFRRDSTGYIGWELLLKYPPPKSQIDFEIEALVYRDDGDVWDQYTQQNYILAHSRGFPYIGASGWDATGNWPAGPYRLDLYVDDELIARGHFTVFD